MRAFLSLLFYFYFPSVFYAEPCVLSQPFAKEQESKILQQEENSMQRIICHMISSTDVFVCIALSF